jgi:tetratricopeptide (TPR) repeat protein
MYYHLGRFYEGQGEIDAAWESYERLMAVSANQAWTNAVLGDFLLRQGLYDQAITHYRAAIRYNPEEPLYPARLGEVYLARLWSAQAVEGDAENAQSGFDESLEKLPEGFPARSYVLAQRGRLYFHVRRYQESIADFNGALEIDPDAPEIQFALARAYDAAQDAQKACAAYDRVLDPKLGIPEDWAAYARERREIVCVQ